MLKYVIGIFIKELLGLLSEAASSYIRLRKKRKEDKVTVDEALKTKDPKIRAARIGDLLS